MGPEGVFIPAPPGSRFGIIIPAPVGTAPAVVTSAPPVINVGMRVNSVVNNTVINNVTNTTVINNVTIIAPASATANHREVNASVPGQAHLAAAMTPVVRATAPKPASSKPIAAFVPGHPVSLPPPQTVRAEVPRELAHQETAPPAKEPARATVPAAESKSMTEREKQAEPTRPAQAGVKEPVKEPAKPAAKAEPPAASAAAQKAAAETAAKKAAAEAAAQRAAAAEAAAKKAAADAAKQRAAAATAEEKAAAATAEKKAAAAEDASKKAAAEAAAKKAEAEEAEKQH
jgi:hypothetical protein